MTEGLAFCLTAWIWANARLFFPTAIQILDFHHAAEQLGVFARTFFGDGEFGITQQSMWASELKRSDVQGILAARQAIARRWSKAS